MWVRIQTANEMPVGMVNKGGLCPSWNLSSLDFVNAGGSTPAIVLAL